MANLIDPNNVIKYLSSHESSNLAVASLYFLAELEELNAKSSDIEKLSALIQKIAEQQDSKYPF